MNLVIDIELFKVLYVVAVGLVTGSYLNVLIYRIPKSIMTVKGSSFCPSCSHKLVWKDLFPLFSYMLLGGRCRYCRCRIPAIYPAVEIVNAGIYLLIYLRYGLTVDALLYAVASSCLIALAAIDAVYKTIPDRFNIVIAVCGIIMLAIPGGVPWYEMIIGTFAISVPLFIISFFTGGVGEGDVKLFAACGLLLGWKLILLSMFLASVTAALFGIVLIVAKKAGRRTEIPFGPFIALGVLVSIFAGGNIIASYLSL